jgi:hypothetical protein
MAVTFDAGSWAPGLGSVSSYNFTNISVGNNGNRFLLAWITSFTAITSPTATWDSGGSNQAMTLTTTQASLTAPITAYMFRLVNPAVGNKTLAFSWTTASNNIGFSASSWFGVNQQAPLYSTSSNNTATTTPAVTINNVQGGDIAVGYFQTVSHSLPAPIPYVQFWNAAFGTGSDWANGATTAGINLTLQTAAAASSDNQISIGTAISRALFASNTPTIMM